MRAISVFLLLLLMTAVAPLGCTSKPPVEPPKAKTDDGPPKEIPLPDPSKAKAR
jgi:hypothetical protein